MGSPYLTFLGAAGTVTGSKFLVDLDEQQVLVDCGLYQGLATWRRKNWEPPPLAPADLSAVVLTHAHLDHCGYLPRLVREGFTGPVLCTADTASLATIVLRDSAHLQEEDARYANRAGFSKHRPALPLYDSHDVEATLPLLTPVEFGVETPLGPDLRVLLEPAGHILGSSVVRVSAGSGQVSFSGDLGRPHHPLLRPPVPPPAARSLVVESTYGDRRHPPPDLSVLADAVSRTVARGGSVLIPAFAVDRTELVLLALHELLRDGAIPRVPVFVDSPMALAALEVYRAAVRGASAQLGPDARRLLTAMTDLEVVAVSDREGSERLNSPRRPSIIISASGMATGGRVVHHLATQLPDPRNSVVLTGYQAEGTRGRALADGVRQLKMYGRYVPVRAEVVAFQDFSVHADADELLAWIGSAPVPPRTVYLVHGEPPAARALAQRIQDELDWCTVVPRLGERVRLD